MFGVTLMAINFTHYADDFLFDQDLQDCADKHRDIYVLKACTIASRAFAVFQARGNSRLTKQALFNIYATQGFTLIEWRAFMQDQL